MTKQEKIREELAQIERVTYDEEGWHRALAMADVVLEYLHSQGVAIVYDIQAPAFGKQWAKFEPLIVEE